MVFYHTLSLAESTLSRRLASQRELARAYRANEQVNEAIVKRKTMTEDHLPRLVSEELLIAFYHTVPWMSGTRQTSEPSIEDAVAEGGREVYQALEIPQAISSNSSACFYTQGISQPPKTSYSRLRAATGGATKIIRIT